MPRKYNLVGQRFGKLTVIEKAGHSKCKKVLWRCKCDCGNESDVPTQSLTSGGTKSCGCCYNELTGARGRKHGKMNTRLYSVWRGMKERCTRESSISYKYYGCRGISVCDEWKESFAAFYKWSIENGYKENLTIDRIDINGDYSPWNCKWYTWDEQQRNRRDNWYITYNGETKVIQDWAKYLGIKQVTLRARINKLGWSIEDAFTTPVKKCSRNKHES